MLERGKDLNVATLGRSSNIAVTLINKGSLDRDMPSKCTKKYKQSAYPWKVPKGLTTAWVLNSESTYNNSRTR